MNRACVNGGVLLALFGLWLPACEYPTFASSSSVDGLQVLALQLDRPTAEPGAAVHFRSLWVDGRRDDASNVARAWFRGCVNPPGDSLLRCLERLNDARGREEAGWPRGFSPVSGDEVSFAVSPEILANRPGYGLEYFFFAACRGGTFEYSASEHDAFPVICRDDRGSPLGPDDFSVAYRTVLVLDGVALPSENPVIEGVEVDGSRIDVDCRDEACVGAPLRDCSAERCPPVRACAGQAGCAPLRIRLLVRREPEEIDWLASVDAPVKERVWARYFVDRGEVEPPLDVLHDRERWSEEPESELLVPPGEVRLWAVAYDSMGGVSFARVTLFVR